MATPESTQLVEQNQRLEVLRIAADLAQSQNSSKYSFLTEEEAKKVENTIDRDTIRNAKKLWKFVKVDPLAEKEES